MSRRMMWFFFSVSDKIMEVAAGVSLQAVLRVHVWSAGAGRLAQVRTGGATWTDLICVLCCSQVRGKQVSLLARWQVLATW